MLFKFIFNFIVFTSSGEPYCDTVSPKPSNVKLIVSVTFFGVILSIDFKPSTKVIGIVISTKPQPKSITFTPLTLFLASLSKRLNSSLSNSKKLSSIIISSEHESTSKILSTLASICSKDNIVSTPTLFNVPIVPNIYSVMLAINVLVDINSVLLT